VSENFRFVDMIFRQKISISNLFSLNSNKGNASLQQKIWKHFSKKKERQINDTPFFY
jgi:hypothetical protein